MGIFTIIGMMVSALIGLFLFWLALQIAGNIYGGIIGGYRLIRLDKGKGNAKGYHWKVIRHGFKSWAGKRYRDGEGIYWQMGGMRVPVDGRDPIVRDRYPG